MFMDLGADYDSGIENYKRSQPSHFFRIFSFFDFFSKFLLFRTILAYFGVHVEALKNID